MSVKATDAGRLPSKSDGRRRPEAAAKRPQSDDSSIEHQPIETEIFITPKAVIIARPDHTSIQGIDGTAYGKPLDELTRDRLRFIESLHFNGVIG